MTIGFDSLEFNAGLVLCLEGFEGTGLTIHDISKSRNHGALSGIVLPVWVQLATGRWILQLDGANAYVDCGSAASLDFGTGEFTILAWIDTQSTLIDVVGDIVSKFDKANKVGFALNVIHNNGKAQANYRQLSFGIDNNHRDVAWVEVAPTLGTETYILSLAVYNGKLYGGTLPNGKLYEWNGVNAWVEVAPTLGAETYIYSLAVYNGKLYGGTSPNSKLYEWNGGRLVTYDYALGSGIKFIAAVKDNLERRLILYVDGLRVAQSSQFTVADFNVNNAENLLVGFGVQDYFNYRIGLPALYSRALSQADIVAIFSHYGWWFGL